MGKKLWSMILVLTLISLFAITSAEAGSKTRYRWQGAGIAVGALLLGGLVAHHIAAHARQPEVIYAPPPEPRYYPPEPDWAPGHWEITREWVPGQWERVWVPDQYDRWGNWVAGHYVDRKTPGHYVERRVWVERHFRDH
jgi:heme A synthase